MLTREANAAPWRELARVYRRLEARGEIRGGRFVSGMSGEQFALGDAIVRLREVRRTPPDGRCLVISAADPLNLAGIVTAGERVRAVAAHATGVLRRRSDGRTRRRLCATIDRADRRRARPRRRGRDDAGGKTDAGGAQWFCREVMMRHAAFVLSLSLLTALPVVAQDKQDKQDKKAPGKGQPKTLSLSGCVVRSESAPNQFTLEDKDEGRFRLSGINMSDYVGRRVQIGGAVPDSKKLVIKGGLTPNANVAAQAGAMDPARAAVACRRRRSWTGNGRPPGVQGEKCPAGQWRMSELTGPAAGMRAIRGKPTSCRSRRNEDRARVAPRTGQ